MRGIMWLWAAGAVVGLLVAIAASKRAVRYASALALGFGVSPFLVGVTLMSIGTDLPEMANSIMASVSGHGDINLGDSIGSAVTQLTLVLGILPFV
ncbi:MAG: sodium:calcium antiporter, partial [Acidimicrobiia bacterium]|nr:sodium:calcium antiporter [Acidimicrobiia bacterium]